MVLMGSQGYPLVLGARTSKDFRMSEAVRRKGQKKKAVGWQYLKRGLDLFGSVLIDGLA